MPDLIAAVDDDGHQAHARPRMLPPPTLPMQVARDLVDQYFRSAGVRTLVYWRGGWWSWRQQRWALVERDAVSKAVYHFTEQAFCISDKGELKRWAPTQSKVSHVVHALRSLCLLSERVEQPAWVATLDDTRFDPMWVAPNDTVVACDNGLLLLRSRTLLPHDPRFFNVVAVPFEYQLGSVPHRWLHFLQQVWPDDPESISALQEWCGYVVAGRLDLHKILLWVGPPRGGKGVTGRVMAQLIGSENVAGPTLHSLGGEFGLAPLLGKSLAIISDARLGAGNTTVVERLLTISGEDRITVNKKYEQQWTGTLPARFVVLSNELPEFADASAAIVSRFVLLISRRSWLGQEDHELEPDLQRELAGILNWSLDGLERLERQHRFTQPTSSRQAVDEMVLLASPIRAFVRDQCAEHGSIPCAELYAAWTAWATANGHRPGSLQMFGRNLRAAYPLITTSQPREAGKQERRWYVGISLV